MRKNIAILIFSYELSSRSVYYIVCRYCKSFQARQIKRTAMDVKFVTGPYIAMHVAITELAIKEGYI